LIQNNNNSLLRLLAHELALTTFLKQYLKINHDILSPQTCICLFLFLQLGGEKDCVNLKTLSKRFHRCGLLNISFNDFLVLINVFLVCEILHKCKIPWKTMKSHKGFFVLNSKKWTIFDHGNMGLTMGGPNQLPLESMTKCEYMLNKARFPSYSCPSKAIKLVMHFCVHSFSLFWLFSLPLCSFPHHIYEYFLSLLTLHSNPIATSLPCIQPLLHNKYTHWLSLL